MITDKKLSKKAEKGHKIEPKTDTSKIYELGYILLPSITEDRALIEEKVLADIFTQNGGGMISGEHPILIDLAYPMLKVVHAHREKCNQGYFGWMKFEIETENITEVKKTLDLSETILRYLLVKTVRENTLLKGKMDFGRKDEKMKKFIEEDEVEVTVPEIPVEIDQEKLDKSIDDLVIA